MNLKFFPLLILAIGALLFNSCSSSKSRAVGADIATQSMTPSKDLSDYSVAYFAGGCFWCVEAVFESVKGVEEVISGYSGGREQDAAYNKVGAGITDHAESVAVYYDPTVINYRTLLEVFFASTDPTTLNRQGPDQGRQYRSSIFYQTIEEKQEADEYIKELNDSGVYNAPIVTEVVKFNAFYPAEDYHQNYEKLHPDNPYVQNVSIPRLRAFQKKRPDLLKENSHQ